MAWVGAQLRPVADQNFLLRRLLTTQVPSPARLSFLYCRSRYPPDPTLHYKANLLLISMCCHQRTTDRCTHNNLYSPGRPSAGRHVIHLRFSGAIAHRRTSAEAFAELAFRGRPDTAGFGARRKDRRLTSRLMRPGPLQDACLSTSERRQRSRAQWALRAVRARESLNARRA
jgi:hypothetical protein